MNLAEGLVVFGGVRWFNSAMGLVLTPEQLKSEATPSQRKAIQRLTGHGELQVIEAELWVRGVLCVVIGDSRRTFTITPRGKVDALGNSERMV